MRLILHEAFLVLARRINGVRIAHRIARGRPLEVVALGLRSPASVLIPAAKLPADAFNTWREWIVSGDLTCPPGSNSSTWLYGSARVGLERQTELSEKRIHRHH